MTYTVSSGTLNPSIPYHTIILSSNKIQNGDIGLLGLSSKVAFKRVLMSMYIW